MKVFRIILGIVITGTFLCQSVAWAGGLADGMYKAFTQRNTQSTEPKAGRGVAGSALKSLTLPNTQSIGSTRVNGVIGGSLKALVQPKPTAGPKAGRGVAGSALKALKEHKIDNRKY